MEEPSKPEWEEPEIVDVNALDDALGACLTGKTQASGCRSGNHNHSGCSSGHDASGTNKCSTGSHKSSGCASGSCD